MRTSREIRDRVTYQGGSTPGGSCEGASGVARRYELFRVAISDRSVRDSTALVVLKAPMELS